MHKFIFVCIYRDFSFCPSDTKKGARDAHERGMTWLENYLLCFIFCFGHVNYPKKQTIHNQASLMLKLKQGIFYLLLFLSSIIFCYRAKFSILKNFLAIACI